MHRRKEFDLVDRQAIGPLDRGDQRDQPVPQKEPLVMEEVKDVKHGGVRQERHGIEVQKATTIDPEVVVEVKERIQKDYQVLPR